MQENVGSSANAHSIVLKLAQGNEIDIFLDGEPWTPRDLPERRSILHHYFLYFLPLSVWHSRPRALT
ncbi:BgTH12-07853 [Blumeria graminis f. sp. triticale]|uniref:BgTH12-02212 n=1 Tax=Blumeria graminis f. sp. triticale TaxID=1689686 RepID=A0A9W4DDX1_BLUGR|nr:BgTH12-02212 [Blumeria graminis f. sp. triticale]CAD6506627.1 BgTH12-07853 [Blumeria graminis f. sp. triticale]